MGALAVIGGRGHEGPTSGAPGRGLVLAGITELELLRECMVVQPEDILDLSEQCGSMVEGVLAPLNRSGDLEGARFDWESGRVVMPTGFPAAFSDFIKAGWAGLAFPAHVGGGDLPWLAQGMVLEHLSGANLPLSMAAMLTVNVVDVLLRQGSGFLRERFVPQLFEGGCSAAMCLSEASAGSDLSGISTYAVRDGPDTWRLSGTKVFVSYGDNDLTEQSLHLVLARTLGAPRGMRGISCFAVPRLLDDGLRNDLHCEGIEHKLGLRASPTCTMRYGDGDGALAYLVGEEHGGLDVLLPLLNTSRILTGMEGLAIGARAAAMAHQYSAERRQGRAPGAVCSPSPIIDHPDVRRTVLTMQALVDAMRSLSYTATVSIDLARRHPDPAIRDAHARRLDVFAPVVKAWCTDVGVEVASMAMQVHGGLGYMEDSGVPQLLRDIRAAPLYEGSNGILAAELVRRRIVDVGALLADSQAEVVSHKGDGPVVAHLCAGVARAGNDVGRATAWMSERLGCGVEGERDALSGAAAYLRLVGVYLGGWALCRTARAASETVASSVDAESMLRSAQVYLDQVLPATHGLVVMACAGSRALFVEMASLEEP
jgi:alkylation response protein AidB-like acyl-CoA dehydrogenase